MSCISDLSIGLNRHDNITHVDIYGHNDSLSSNWELLTFSGQGQFPTPSQAKQLRVAAGGNANDIFGGSGGNTILLEGINQLGERVQETIPLSGTSASQLSVNTYLRLNRAVVIQAGQYDTLLTGSHAGLITIEDADSNVWIELPVELSYAQGLSGVGYYSTPKDENAYLDAITVTPDGNQAVDVLVVVRRFYLNETAPYAPSLIFAEWNGLTSQFTPDIDIPAGPIFPQSDLLFLVRQSSGSGGEVNVNFKLILEKIA